MDNSIRKYGQQPYQIGLLHGGPGAAGEMKPVAETLSKDFGVLECLQTEKSINRQIKELHEQLTSSAEIPVILIGFSWGAWLGILFASKYPNLVKKLILISSGALESKYNVDLMKIRLNRLSKSNREEAEKIIATINANNSDNETLKRFGELMTIADSFDYLSDDSDSIELNMEIYQSVWQEAARLRDTNELINCADKIECPIVVFHGEFDPHPIDGVEKPLSERVKNAKIVRLQKCGHTPWKEVFAKDEFYRLLRDELR